MTIGANITDTFTAATLATSGKGWGLGDKWTDKDGKTYKFVKYNAGAGSVAAVSGNFCYYYAASGASAGQTTEVTSDLSDSANVGAGKLCSAPATGEYCWIQIKGPATLNTALTAGADGNALNQTISSAAASSVLKLDKNVTTQASLITGSMAGVARWQIAVGGVGAETGSNAGTPFQIMNFSDAGSFIGIPLSITRGTGVVTMPFGATVGDASGDPVILKGTTVNSYSSGLLDNADAAAWRTDLGLGSAAVLTAGDASGNLKALNTDGGFTFALTAATQAIEHDGFGGLFNSAAAGGNSHLALTGTHTGPRFTQAFTIETEGGNSNGPGSSVYPVWLHSQKTDYLTSTTTGEVDGGYILVNQGLNGDAGGLLIAVNKVDGGTGGITCIETVATRIDSDGDAVLSNDVVLNFLEGVGALSAGGGHGVYSEARHGTIFSAFTAAAGNDAAFGANLTNFFVGSLSRDPSDIRFKVSTNGVLSLTSTTAQNMLELITFDASATAGSGILLDRVSASPAAGDIISQILFRGRDDAAAQSAYGQMTVTAQNVTAASKGGRFGFYTLNGGTSAERLRIAAGVYHPSATGADKGNNTINFGAVYDDNVLLTDYVFDRWLGRDGEYSARVREKADALDASMFDLATYIGYSRANGRLWGMPDLNDVIDGAVKEHSLGAMVQKLWQTAEIMSIHDAELLGRVINLEERLTA